FRGGDANGRRAPGAERTSRGGQDHAPYVFPAAPAHGLEQRIVLGIDRQHGRPRGCGAAHEQGAGANQTFLVGERHDRAPLRRRQGGLEPGGSGNRPNHPLRRPRSGFHQRAFACTSLDAGAGKRLLQVAIGRRIADRSKTRIQFARKRRQRASIPMRAHRFHPVLRSFPHDQVDGAGTDRAARAKDRDAALGGGARSLIPGYAVHRHRGYHTRRPRAGACTPPCATPISAARAAAARKPSSRSISPPWPGIRLLASLAPKRRFNADSNRSPPWAAIESTPARNASAKRFASPAAIAIMSAATMAAMMPPVAPDQVFFGLTRGARFGPPSARPTK